MQRLYSMFPKGLPGVALALMRFSLGLGFAQEQWSLLASQQQAMLLAGVFVIAAGLCLGLFTPLMCLACAGAEIASWVLEGTAWQRVHVCTVLNAIALAMLGPGAFSLDGRAFGRRKIDFRPSRLPEDDA